jgi:hypothetical protein
MWWHAQKPDFIFRRNGRIHLNRRGRQFSRLLAAEVCASAVVMLDTPCSEVAWKVLATHSIRQFPLHFLSLASPCAITFQLDSSPLEIQMHWNLIGSSMTHQPPVLSPSSILPPSLPHCVFILAKKNQAHLINVRIKFLVPFAKLRKISLCLSVRPSSHWTNQLLLDGFLWNLILETFSKVCRETSDYIKIWQE